jgi:hypothetical protein
MVQKGSMMRKNYAKQKMHGAIQVLAGAGDLEDRIAAAAGVLIHIDETDIPSQLATELADLKLMLFDMSDSPRGIFFARNPSNETAKLAAVKFINLYTTLVRL